MQSCFQLGLFLNYTVSCITYDIMSKHFGKKNITQDLNQQPQIKIFKPLWGLIPLVATDPFHSVFSSDMELVGSEGRERPCCSLLLTNTSQRLKKA